MADQIEILSDWAAWLKANPVAARYVKGTRRSDPASYFLRTHALTETILRRAVLVGLRRKGAMYSEALAWLEDNDTTPDRVRYPVVMDTLFGGNPSWAALTIAGSNLGELWPLWLDFTKVLRNHLAHGIRTYSVDWLECGAKIDQAFIMEFCRCFTPLVGGSLGDDMKKLKPRLGTGKAGTDIAALVGRRSGKPRPKLSLQSASQAFGLLGIV